MKEKRLEPLLEKVQATFAVAAIISVIVSTILFVIIYIWNAIIPGMVPVEILYIMMATLCMPYVWAVIHCVNKTFTAIRTKKKE